MPSKSVSVEVTKEPPASQTSTSLNSIGWPFASRVTIPAKPLTPPPTSSTSVPTAPSQPPRRSQRVSPAAARNAVLAWSPISSSPRATRAPPAAGHAS